MRGVVHFWRKLSALELVRLSGVDRAGEAAAVAAPGGGLVAESTPPTGEEGEAASAPRRVEGEAGAEPAPPPLAKVFLLFHEIPLCLHNKNCCVAIGHFFRVGAGGALLVVVLLFR